jgi:hypothetical protein
VSRHRKHEILIVLGIICAAALLRAGVVDRHGLWADEVFSLAIATGHSLEHPAAIADAAKGDYVEPPLAVPASYFKAYARHETPPASTVRIIRAVRLSDTNPPLYYVLLGLWTRAFGTTDETLRVFSVFLAMASFPGLCILARHTGGRPAVVPACALFAAAPVALYFSTEGRMYSLLWCLAVSQAAASVSLNRRGARVGTAIAWLLAGAAGLLTHYFYLFVWVANVAWLSLWPGKLGRRALGGMALTTIVVILPWYLLLPDTLGRWRVTGGWLNEFPGWRRTLRAPMTLAWSLLSGRGRWGGAVWGEYVASLAFVMVALGVWMRISLRVFSPRRAFLWTWLLAACLGPPALDLVLGTKTGSVPRYALAGLPAALLLAAVGLGRVGPVVRGSILLLILIAWAPGAYGVFAFPRHSHTFRAIAAGVGSSIEVSEVLLVHSIPSGVVGLSRYLKDDVPVASWVGQLGRRRVPEDIEALTAGRTRVVLVNVHAVGAPPLEEDWLREHASLSSEAREGRARILAFVPREGTHFLWPSAGTRP